MLARWLDTDEAKKDPNFAPLKVFDIIGYGKTATSPVEDITTPKSTSVFSRR